MDTILRLHFNPVDKIFPDNYRGKEFIDIADPAYIPLTGDKVYFEAATYITNAGIADKVVKLMDYDGFKVKIWRVDYQTEKTIVSGSLTTSANFETS